MKLLFLLLVCCSCGSSNTPASNTDATNIGDTINVKLNEQFDVKLGAVMATGYSWSLLDSSYRSHVTLDTMFTIINSDREGDPETQVFRFKAISKGETVLHFVHIRPWRKTDPPTKTKDYKVFIN